MSLEKSITIRHLSYDQGIEVLNSVSVADAAHILGYHRDHLARRCREQLVTAGLARFGKLNNTGQPGWFIDRRFDPRLEFDAESSVVPIEELQRYPQSKVEDAYRRIQCVMQYRVARETWEANQQDWLPILVAQLRKEYPDLQVGESSLRRWHKKYRTPADILKFVHKRGGNTRGRADRNAIDFFRQCYLDERQPTIKSCWERTRDEATKEGWVWTSYSAVRRSLDKWIPPEVAARYRSPKTYRDRFAPYVQMAPDAWPAGAVWIGDHCQLDLWCRYRDQLIRPWLTVWMDWRTRKIVGWMLSTSPNSHTINCALRSAMLDKTNAGGPDAVYIDNGRDYDAWVFHGQTKQQRRQRALDRGYVPEDTFRGIYGWLKIGVHFALPRNAKAKGRLERWFGTLHDQFDKTFASYAGRSPEHRPEQLRRVLKDRRNVPTFDHVRDRLGDFVKGYNADSNHAKQDMAGLSPNQAFADGVKRVRKYDPAALDLLLMHWHQPVSVTRNGVSIAPLGRAIQYGATSSQLSRFKAASKAKRQKVLVSYDPDDLSSVRVYTTEGQFVCEAMQNTRGLAADTKFGREHLAKAQKQKANLHKAHQTIHRSGIAEILSTAELAALKAAEDVSPQPTRDAPLKLVQTPLDGQTKAIRKEEKMRTAGAEEAGDSHVDVPAFDLQGTPQLTDDTQSPVDDPPNLLDLPFRSQATHESDNEPPGWRDMAQDSPS